jgi:ornithine cyclodeaminase/alanine dehydrogenase-like protein (mu-crystallin family)
MTTRAPRVLVLGRSDVAELLGLAECIAAVEDAFRREAEGRTFPAGVLSIPAAGGGFHVKAGGLRGERPVFAAKVNANFAGNRERYGLPTIQGVIVFCDAERGSPLAVLDSAEITVLRTAAATGVAARHLARPDSAVATVCGCGRQARAQLAALAEVLPLKRAYACDIDATAAERFGLEMSQALGFPVEAAAELAGAARRSDVVVTCTPSRAPLLFPGDVRPGSFVAAVGADSPDKQELHPGVLAASRVVVDVLAQCAEMGEVHHALAAGVLARRDVHAELAEVVAGRKPGRVAPGETFVFDSTGTALEDVAAAAAAYEKAIARGRGLSVDLAG